MIDNIDSNINTVSEAEFHKHLEEYDESGSEYIKEYILANNLNEYAKQKTLNTLEAGDVGWSKPTKEYMHGLFKLIKENNW